jgi:hypothetical protein
MPTSLLALASLALVSGWVLTQASAPQPVVALAGALLALALPGIVLTRAMFPGPGMGRAERTALVLGIQFALVVMCGFLLHFLRPGLSRAAWGAILADITLIACALAWVRERSLPWKGPASRKAAAQAERGWVATFGGAPTSQLVMLLGAVLLVVAALAVARAGVAWQPQPAWTGLAIAPTDGGRAVAVRVVDAEGSAQTYRLVATIDGQPLATIEALSVPDGGSVTQVMPLPAAGTFLRAVDVGLWRSTDPPDGPPYRSVQISLRGVPGP